MVARKSRFGMALTLLLMFVASSVAAGDTWTQWCEFGGTDEYTVTLTFERYGGPQPLTGIHFGGGTTAYRGLVLIDNDRTEPIYLMLELSTLEDWSSPDVRLPGWPFGGGRGRDFHLAADNGDGPGNVDPNPPDGGTFDLGEGSGGSGGSFGVPQEYWDDYVGNGTFDLRVHAYSIPEQIVDGHVCDLPDGVETEMISIVSGGRISLTYTYVPEPNVLLLLGAGIATVLARRRSRSTAFAVATATAGKLGRRQSMVEVVGLPQNGLMDGRGLGGDVLGRVVQ